MGRKDQRGKYTNYGEKAGLWENQNTTRVAHTGGVGFHLRMKNKRAPGLKQFPLGGSSLKVVEDRVG